MNTTSLRNRPSASLFQHLRAQLGESFEVFDCTKATLVHVSHAVEDLILRERMPALLLTGFQESGHWRAEAERYRALADVACQVCIFAGGTLGSDSHEREIRVTLLGDDPLRQEWFVCALTPRLSFVLCGQDRNIAALDEATRQFRTFWTFEPAVIGEVLDLLEDVVERYRPERRAELRRARAQLPPTQPDARLMAQLLRELIRFEDQLQRVNHERAERYTIVTELTTDSLYTAHVASDQRLSYEWLGDGWARLTDGAAPEPDGLMALAHPDDRSLAQARLSALLAGRDDVSEYRIVTPGGDTRWVRDHARPIADRRSQRVRLIAGAVSDITSQKRDQEALRAVQALQQSNSLLEERVEERTGALLDTLRRAQALYAITNDAIASENLAEALQRAVERAGATLNADRVLLTILDWETRTIAQFLRAGRSPERVFGGVSFDELMSGLTGWAVRERRPAISPKNTIDPRESPLVQRRRADTESGSVIVLPLVYLNDVYGTLTAINLPDEPDFTAEDIDLMSAIAGQIALAYARMRLNAHLQQANVALTREVSERTALSNQMQQLAEYATATALFSRALAEASRELTPLYHTIAESTARLIGGACAVTLLAPDGQSVETVAVSDGRPEDATPLMLRAAPDAAFLDRVREVIQSGQPLTAPGPRAGLIAPLQVHGRTLGTVAVFRDRPYADADQAFLQDLADRAGLAIENARLFTVAALARAEAERANRAKDEFLATMSHELRTPLNAVLGYSESLQEGIYGELTQRQRAPVVAIESAGRHLLALITDILDLAKIEADRLSLQIQRVSLGEISTASLLFVREQALKKRLDLSLEIGAPDATLEADPARLKQMLINLLSNAVKFTPDGGAVGLRATVDADEGIARFVVSDTGVGISAADLGRLFQPFSQVDSSLSRSYEGTGLGLALVRRLAALHGGSVTVESVVGQGSRFTIALPYAVAAAPADAAAGLSEDVRHRADEA